MVTITKYTHGGCRVVTINGDYFKIVSRHLSKRTAASKDNKYDKCDKIVNKGTWWFRLNRLSKDATDKIKKMSSQAA